MPQSSPCAPAAGDNATAGMPVKRLQPMRQRVDELERALYRCLGLQRVQIGKAGQPRHLFVEARVVLHRARAERIEAAVDRVVFLREPGEVADHLRLAEAGQADRPLPLKPAEATAMRRRLGKIDAATAG